MDALPRAQEILMRMSLLLSLLGLAATGMAQTNALYPTDRIPQFVVSWLDVTSFPSSIGPRREKGKTSFQDYGFYPVTITERQAALELRDGSWRFTIEVLKRTDAGILVCITDTAQNGGTYKAQGPLLLVRPDAKSMLRADQKAVEATACPKFAH